MPPQAILLKSHPLHEICDISGGAYSNEAISRERRIKNRGKPSEFISAHIRWIHMFGDFRTGTARPQTGVRRIYALALYHLLPIPSLVQPAATSHSITHCCDNVSTGPHLRRGMRGTLQPTLAGPKAHRGRSQSAAGVCASALSDDPRLILNIC